MSRRHELQQKLASLGEIAGIMMAMKNLAFMETRKLAGFLATQQRAVASIETAAGDFLRFFGERLPGPGAISEACLAIGSERGLCGNFNERVVETLRAHFHPDAIPPIVAVGRRLDSALGGSTAPDTLLEGPSVAEEVEKILTMVAGRLAEMESVLPPGTVLGLTVFYHSGEAGDIRIRRLLPLPDPGAPFQNHSHAPLLNLPPVRVFARITEHYLYAALHEAFYASLMAENRYRLEHTDTAVRRLDKRIADLELRNNVLRQEEITEEIEVIMLSAATLADR